MSNNLKLCQVVALEKGAKSRTHEEVTALHRISSQPELFFGLSRSYQPKDENGEVLVGENKLIQKHVEQNLSSAANLWADLANVLLTKESGNCEASADIVVDGKTLVPKVPVSFLIQFEKMLEDMAKFVSSLPALPESEKWTYDNALGIFSSDPIQSARTIRSSEYVVVPNSGVPEKGVPPQVKELVKDLTVGTWFTTKYSSAIAPTKRQELVNRINAVRDAVKIAREEANTLLVKQRKDIGDVILSLLQL